MLSVEVPVGVHIEKCQMHHLLTAVQLLSHVQASLSFTVSRSLLKLMSTESVMPSNHVILCCPLLLLPSIFPSIRVFSSELVLCIMCQKLELQLQYQSFQ